jgi:hypothetical protein
VTCRLEWDPPAGLMYTAIPMLVFLTPLGGGEAGDAAEVVGSAGAGSGGTGTPGGKGKIS